MEVVASGGRLPFWAWLDARVPGVAYALAPGGSAPRKRSNFQPLVDALAKGPNRSVFIAVGAPRRGLNEASRRASRKHCPSKGDEALVSTRVEEALSLKRGRSARLGARRGSVVFGPGNARLPWPRQYSPQLTEAAVPPNAPRLIRFLFDVHGEELFELGQFNADPHPGNIMCAHGVARSLDSSG